MNADTGESSIGTELTSPIEDVLLLMPEEETQKTKSNATTTATSSQAIKTHEEKVNEECDEEGDNKILVDSSKEIADKSKANNTHQFQISIHAGHEEDLELNFDSFNDSINTQTNNTNNNDASKNSNTSNNNQLNLNGSNISNENQSGDVGDAKMDTVNTSSSNGSINESGEHSEHLKTRRDSTKESGEREKHDKERNKNSLKLGIDEHVISDIKYIFKNTRYFLMKSNNHENIELAKAKVRLICISNLISKMITNFVC
jgi:YTH domain-containing protein 1